ncbi:MAG: hypothetical protein GY861_10995 [bacterium]|nr:hypothetical protein [bacterium]
MAQVINLDLPSSGEWVDINTASGIAVGSDLTIQCTGTVWVRLQESSTTPSTEEEGKLITNLSEANAEAQVINAPLRLWGRSTREGRTAQIAVQLL